MSKQKKLMADEFVPVTTVEQFWMLPKGIAICEHLSTGAKLLYAVLGGLAGKGGVAYPKKETLKKHMGNPSEKTLYRWQKELERMHLIRVLQKGRGLSNNYYFVRTSWIQESLLEDDDGIRRHIYVDPDTKERSLLTHYEYMSRFIEAAEEWSRTGKKMGKPFPKMYAGYPRSDYLEMKSWYQTPSEPIDVESLMRGEFK